MKDRLWIAISLVFAFAAATMGHAQTVPARTVPWPAVDGLGRKLPTPEEVGPPKDDRFVGIFYFLWLNERHNRSPNWKGPYDVARILNADPDAIRKPDSPLWGKIGTSHYWGEPLFGYYLATDPWVIRRHAMLLADAGIDTLIFDTTNAVTYREQYLKLCEVFEQIRREGGTTPQFAFMVNTEAGKTARKIYEELYKPGHHAELWFRWRGKPLLICDPKEADAELKEFFTLRRAHWPFEIVNTRNAWHWEAAYPQVYGYSEDPNRPEQVNVSVAQNLKISGGLPTNMSEGNARGRSFHSGKQDTAPGAINHGYNFAEQWQRAHALAAPFVMVTGWNEWIAGRWGTPQGPITFVDQFTQEYSRDIEPMRGGHGDNYYWQMLANVRRYKGSSALPKASGPVTIRVDGGFEPWKDVGPTFVDHVNETLPRDFEGAGGLHYTNRSGRNDFVACKVARDAQTVYFYVRTKEPITPRTGSHWMWLLINADGDSANGWEGYDFLLNRQVESDSTTSLEQCTGGWNWKPRAKVSYRVQGNELQVAIPRSALGIEENTSRLSIDFKWADNLQSPGDILDVYVSGDVAPEGRFSYRYTAQ
jgi:hypothetical protein